MVTQFQFPPSLSSTSFIGDSGLVQKLKTVLSMLADTEDRATNTSSWDSHVSEAFDSTPALILYEFK